VTLRISDYAKRVDEYHVIVFTLKNQGLKFKNIGNLYIYPTNSYSKLTYILGAYFLGNKILSRTNHDNWVISSQDPFETAIPSYFLKRKYGIPLQIQIHTDYLSSYFKNNFLNLLRVSIANFVVNHANQIRVVSSVIKDSVLEKFPSLKSKIDILPIYVDIDRIVSYVPTVDIKKDFSKFDFIVLMASRLTKEKRIDVGIQSMKIVVEKYPRTGLVVCGSGGERDRLMALSYSQNIASSVVFVGWKNNLLDYLKTSDVFLLTSEYEGYGMTLVEAAASGCPIVTTKVGLAKTDLFKNGYNSSVCLNNDVQSIAESIIELIENQSKRELYKSTMKDSIMAISSSREEYSDRYIGLLNKMLNNEGFN
jgi:glycosyltransferase involved in cell wall biosynthesis